METLVKSIHKAWLEAKSRAAREAEQRGDIQFAAALNDCKMFTGRETLEELVKMMFSPRGIEFMTQFGFPSLSQLRKFKKYDTSRFGVYIDAGEFGLIEPQPRNVFLIGDTRATIRCSETQLYRVFVMHGAKATINASGFAVVKTEIDRDKHSNISISTYGHSRAL